MRKLSWRSPLLRSRSHRISAASRRPIRPGRSPSWCRSRPAARSISVARLLLDRLRAALGQPLIVENLGGASGTIGTGRAVRAAPDGYTLNMGNWTSHLGGPAMYPISYDILKDLEPVSMLLISPTVIVGRHNLPPNNLQELIAWLKANPDKATAATVGAGSPGHVSRHPFPERHRHAHPVRALSRRRSGQPGSAGRPGRSADRGRGLADAAAYPQRPHQGLRHHVQEALGGRAGGADDRGSGRSRHPDRAVDRIVGAQGHAAATSSCGSTRRSARRWPTRSRASASPTPASIFRRPSNSRRKRSPPTTRARPRNGGRSSRAANIKAE